MSTVIHDRVVGSLRGLGLGSNPDTVPGKEMAGKVWGSTAPASLDLLIRLEVRSRPG